jgi:hypothetical protein
MALVVGREARAVRRLVLEGNDCHAATRRSDVAFDVDKRGIERGNAKNLSARCIAWCI